MRLLHLSVTTALLTLLPLVPALASSVPSSARPERVIGPGEPDKPRVVPVRPQAEQPAAPLLPRPAGAEKITLRLQTIALEGATAFTDDTLEKLWAAQLDQTITLADVYTLADAITRKYRNAGYTFARTLVPEQEIKNGTVRILVEEGRVGSVTYEGPYASTKTVGTVISRLQAMQLFNLLQIEREILLLNDLPGLKARVVLLPGEQTSVNLTVVGEADENLTGSAQFDNSGSRYLGPYLLGASVTAGNLLGSLSQTTLSANTALQLNELSSLGLTHTLALGRPDLQLKGSLLLTRGEPGYTLKSSDIDSHSLQGGLMLNYTLLRQRTETLVLSMGFEAEKSRADIAGSKLSEDNSRSLSLGARYEWGDRLNGYNLVQAQLAKGLPGFLGGSRTGDADLSRGAAQLDAIRTQLTLQRYQQLGQRFSFLGAVRGQLATGPLLAGDEFGYGGSFIGRAYDTSEMTGDSGLSALAELRALAVDRGQLQVQPFIFADYGIVWNRDAGQPSRDEGVSAGVGVQADYKNAQGRITLAQPLLESTASTYPNNPGPRLLFSVQASF